MVLCGHLVDGILVVPEGFTLELGVVHLAEDVDQVLEEVAAVLEVVEVELPVADVQHEVQHVALALERAEGVDGVEGILLEDDEVHEFGLPEVHVVTHRDAVVTEDVDLLAGLLAAADEVLGGLDLLPPAGFDGLVQVFPDLRIVQILGVGIQRGDGRVTLL